MMCVKYLTSFNIVMSNCLTRELHCDVTVLPDHMSPTSVSSIVGDYS